MGSCNKPPPGGLLLQTTLPYTPYVTPAVPACIRDIFPAPCGCYGEQTAGLWEHCS